MSVEVLDGPEAKEGLGFWEGYLFAAKQASQLNEIQTALALYTVKTERLYVKAGFKNFKDYVEAKVRWVSKSTALRWVDDVHELTPDTFRDLSAKIGISHSFFQRFALLPAEVQDAIVKGDNIEVDGKTYDLKGGDKKIYREVIMALISKTKSLEDRYNSEGRLKKRNQNLEKEKEGLIRELADARKGLSGDAAHALKILEDHRETCIGTYELLKNSDPTGADDIVRADLLSTVSFLHAIFELLMHRLSSLFDIEQRYPGYMVDDEEKRFQEQFKKYLKPEEAPAK
jgi:hypothetical protein